jgi:hypothetical protein
VGRRTPRLGGPADRCRTCTPRPARSTPPPQPGPHRGPTTPGRVRSRTPRLTRRSAQCGPRSGAAVPPRHVRPGPYPRPGPTGPYPTRYACPPERCTRFYCGYDLDTHILTGRVHLSRISSDAGVICLNTRGQRRSVKTARTGRPGSVWLTVAGRAVVLRSGSVPVGVAVTNTEHSSASPGWWTRVAQVRHTDAGKSPGP